jgi:response regulator of citrate/malate metabolism
MTQTSTAQVRIDVLLIEDNPGDARLVRELLNDTAPGMFHLDTSGSVSEAKEVLAAGRRDVVLLDLTLPDSTGLDTFRKIAACISPKRVIVLTGVEDGAVEKELMAAGAFDYLPKRHLEGNLLWRIIRNTLNTDGGHFAGERP